MSGEPVWCRLKPPPLPEPSAPQYHELVNFLYADQDRKETLRAYYNECGGVFPPTTPDIGQTTEVAAASTGTILAILFTLLVVGVVAFIVVFYIMKRKRDHKRQSSNALKLEVYDKTNYLHNKAVINKPFNSSSAEEGTIEHKTNGMAIPETGKGDVPEKDNTVNRIKRKSKDSIEKGAVNACYAADESEQPPSPGAKSIKSDTPLIDSIDGMLHSLPNQVPPEGTKSQTIVDVKNGILYGSTNTSSVPKGGTLPPIDKKPASGETNGIEVETRSKKSSKRSPKKKGKGIAGLRASEPCQNTNALVKDLADNRKSV